MFLLLFREFVIYCHVSVKAVCSNVRALLTKRALCTYKHFVS